MRGVHSSGFAMRAANLDAWPGRRSASRSKTINEPRRTSWSSSSCTVDVSSGCAPRKSCLSFSSSSWAVLKVVTAAEVAVDDDCPDVLGQLPEVLGTDLVLGGRDEVAEDPQPRREVRRVVDAVEKHPVEEERLRVAELGRRAERVAAQLEEVRLAGGEEMELAGFARGGERLGEPRGHVDAVPLVERVEEEVRGGPRRWGGPSRTPPARDPRRGRRHRPRRATPAAV